MSTNLSTYHPMLLTMQMSAAYWQGVFEMQSSMLKAWSHGPIAANAMAPRPGVSELERGRPKRKSDSAVTAPFDDGKLPV